MSLKYGLLGLLNYDDMTGYDLSKTFKESLSFFWQAQSSQIYRELNNMEESNWLCSRIEIQTDKPNRRVYSITEKGRMVLQSWLQTDMPLYFHPARSEMLMRIFFSAENDIVDNIQALEKVEKAYYEQIERIKMANVIIAQYSPKANSEMDIMAWKLTGKFGLEYCEMCIKWIHSSIDELKLYKKENQ